MIRCVLRLVPRFHFSKPWILQGVCNVDLRRQALWHSRTGCHRAFSFLRVKRFTERGGEDILLERMQIFAFLLMNRIDEIFENCEEKQKYC